MDDVNSMTESNSRPAFDLVQVLLTTLRSPQLGSLVVMAAAITLGAGLIMNAQAPDYVVVLEHMDEKDGTQIMALLDSSQYDYKVDPNTGSILVPRKKLPQIRIELSSAGLSGHSDVGIELLQQENSLGTSQFIETARYQHALETELSRTISSMRNIKTARVHLAMPKQSVFIRNRAKASASVMIQPLGGRNVEEGQVTSIVNLVASSIPYLESAQVTVVDQRGRLLSSMDDGSGVKQSRTQYDYTRKLEALLSDRVESLLTPLVGEGRIRTSVTADIDFTENEQTQELFEPDPTQLRSEQTRESQSGTAGGAAGVPGALTNQPNGTTPIASQLPTPGNINNQSTRNFELDKTIRHTRQAPGTIRRLSVAIIVDDKTVMNDAGESERVAISAEEIEKLTTLAKEAIGFEETRGDSVYVFNQSFQPMQEIEPIAPLPIWQTAWVQGLVKQVFYGLAVLLLILLVIRPAMKNLSARSVEQISSGEDAAIADENSEQVTESNPESLPAPTAVYGDILHVARAMANDDPARVARVVKDWVEQ